MKNKSMQFLDLLIERYPILLGNKEQILMAFQTILKSYKNNGKMLCCGNGGSAADADHIVGELMKGFVQKRTISLDLKKKINDDRLADVLQYALPTISLVSQPALMTAFANDQLAEASFAQQVLGYGKEGDVLLCISTSGNSLNCVYAAKTAKALGMKIVSLTGSMNSKLSQISDVTIQVPFTETYQIQEYHLPVYHTLCLMIENEFFGD